MKKAFTFLLFTALLSRLLAQPTVTVGPYLQSPTQSSIIIKWWTDSATVSTIAYGETKSNLSATVTDTAVVQRHTVKLTGLQPYTKYYYALMNDTLMLEGADDNHWFRTFPAAGAEVTTRVWAIGDFGKGNTEQARVRDAYLHLDTTETNVWLWLGDNVYQDGTEAEYLAKVFDTVYGYRNNMKYMPFEPCPGNHDYNSISPVTSPQPPLQHTGPYYNFVDVYRNGEAGGVASGNELYYSFDYGNAHFISINSEIGSILNPADDWTGVNPFFSFSTSPMKQWLIQDLQANTKPWVIAYFHQPPFTDGSHESTAFYEVYMKAMRENFTPILEQYGVDIILCGHTHVYERSYLVYGCYGVPADVTPANFLQTTSGNDAVGEAYIKYTQGPTPNRGTVYVNNGNSGSKEGSAAFNHPYMYSEYGCDTCCGSFVMDITANRLNGRHIDMNGNTRDNFTIIKQNTAPSGITEPAGEALFKNLHVVPNPFGNVTQVNFYLTKNEQVQLKITDAAGKAVELYNTTLSKGHQSLAIDAQKLNLSNGAYVVTLQAGSFHSAKTIIKVQ